MSRKQKTQPQKRPSSNFGRGPRRIVLDLRFFSDAVDPQPPRKSKLLVFSSLLTEWIIRCISMRLEEIESVMFSPNRSIPSQRPNGLNSLEPVGTRLSRN